MPRIFKFMPLVLAFSLLLFSGCIVAKPVSSKGKYLPFKGGELEDLRQWVKYQAPVSDLNLAWARIDISWFNVETNPGVYDFDGPEYTNFKNAVISAKSMGAEIILVVKGVPDPYLYPTPYATAPAPDAAPTPWPSHCGRISLWGNPSGTDRLKFFLVAVLNRLKTDMQLPVSDPPPIRYIELWNEPDAQAYQTEPDYYGCWGQDPSKTNGVPPPFEVGVYYAQVLNAIAPYVKGQFLISGTHNSYIKFVAGAAADPKGGFLDTVIDNSIDNIDVVSYHIYVNTNNSYCDIPAYISQEESAFTYVRNYLDNHNGLSIPILISEGSMGYTPHGTQTPMPTAAPSFYNCQAQFASALMDWVKNKTSSGNLLGFIWYTVGVNGWRDTDLFYDDKTPKPAYYIWKNGGR
jgi:hypothetical protein